jgi:hypothetical protein
VLACKHLRGGGGGADGASAATKDVLNKTLPHEIERDEKLPEMNTSDPRLREGKACVQDEKGERREYRGPSVLSI